jgi:hypothetical protein
VGKQDAKGPTLLREKSGTPIVGLYENNPNHAGDKQAFVVRFDGTRWATLAGPIDPTPAGGLADGVGFALDASDRLYADVLGLDSGDLFLLAVNH